MSTRWIAVLGLALRASATALAADEVAPLRFTVAEAIARAEAASPRLGQLAALQQAAAADGEAARSGARPLVDVSLGYTHYSRVPELTVAAPGAGPRTVALDLANDYRSRAAVSLPLYTGGRVAQAVASAAGELEAARQDGAAGKAELVLETTTAYWTLVTQRESERVLAEAIASYDAHLVDAKNREHFGLAAANEVLAVQVERDQAELTRLAAGNAALLAEANLARLLDLPAASRIEPVEDLAAPTPGTEAPEDLVQHALASRPERAALAERVKAADARAAGQKAGARPQVVVSAGYDFANPNRRTVPAEDVWRGGWDAGISASWAVFDSGRTRAAVAEAAARAEAARKALTDLEQRIRLEVTERRLDVDTSRAAVQVTEQQVRSARENRRVSAERYKAGVSPSSELLDAETMMLRVGLSRTIALAQLRIAQAALARAVGN